MFQPSMTLHIVVYYTPHADLSETSQAIMASDNIFTHVLQTYTLCSRYNVYLLNL